MALRLAVCAFLLSGVASGLAAGQQLSTEDAAKAIEPDWIAPHVRFLADSALQGRDTLSPGYDIAAKYVAAQFETLGLKPAGDSGTFFQRVPLRQSSVEPGSATLQIDAAGAKHTLVFERDFVVHASGSEDGIDATGPLVFAGYGISAPQYGYDDYAGIDARGKIVVYIPGMPGALPRDVAAVEGRIARRIDNAKEHGAIGVIEIAPAQPMKSIRERSIRQMGGIMWLDETGKANSLFLSGGYAIVTKEGIDAFLAGQPHTAAEIRDGLKKGPFSFAMNGVATLRARFAHRDESTVNVAAVLPGRELPNEYVVYSAHLDHEGVSDFFPDDHVLHGALDNAGGVATLLAMARAFQATEGPRRSILFLVVTAEEKGLVGSSYFVHHPTVPRDAIVADVNCDNFLWYGPLHDIAGIGRSYSTLDAEFVDAAKRVHLEPSAVTMAVPGVFVLSDHFSFLAAGIPAVSLMNGEQSGDGKRNGTEMWADYMKNIHHTPKDSIDQAIDWKAAVTEAQFAFVLANEIANAKERPSLNSSAFFVSTAR